MTFCLFMDQVQNEVGLQFSSGMQTVAVIPIPLHAVVQLGSSLPMPEDLSFVQEVKSMILLLSGVLGVPLSDSCISTKNLKDLEQTAPYARFVRLYFCSVATYDRFVSALWLQQSRHLP
ncbi:hypothetical protein Droror1_Dr00027958 [Drosera rotundifolia]